MKGRWIDWLPEELAWIEARKDWPRDRLHSAFVFQFGRTDISIGALKALCKRKRWLTGRTGQFQAGQAGGSLDGVHKAAFVQGGLATRFKKGSRTGRANFLYRPIGAERVSLDGYLQRKVNDDLPFNQRWVNVQRINWESAHGPVPSGHVLKCLDGNKLNVDPSNWRAIPIGMLPRLNGKSGRDYDHAPAELKPLIMATAQLEHAARERRKP